MYGAVFPIRVKRVRLSFATGPEIREGSLIQDGIMSSIFFVWPFSRFGPVQLTLAP
jgi:hypothetical protein